MRLPKILVLIICDAGGSAAGAGQSIAQGGKGGEDGEGGEGCAGGEGEGPCPPKGTGCEGSGREGGGSSASQDVLWSLSPQANVYLPHAREL